MYICDECVDIAVQIVTHNRNDHRGSEVPDRGSADVVAICSVCRLPAPAEQSTLIGNRGILCAGCIGEIEAALARRKERE